MSMISSNLQQVRARIAQACARAGRPASAVQLLAVSKTFGPDAVMAAVAAGQRAFGENYVQEGVDKVLALRQAGCTGLEWHCIGPVQSNKTRLVATHFDWVQSVDRLKTAQRLSDHRPADMPPLQVCVQVNMDGGPNKSGVPPQEAHALALAVAGLPRLQLRGLMAIPEPAPNAAVASEVLGRVRELFDTLNGLGLGLDTLSMGMSDDLEAAVASGSTCVRVGRAVFGTRV